MCATVEAVDPIVLGVKLVDICDAHCCEGTLSEIPPAIAACFGCDLSMGDDRRRVYVTLGQFSIIRLERDSQLLMPAFSYCIPDKECIGGSDDDPCEIFRNVKFPVDEFFPPNSLSSPEGYREAKNICT